jgi:dihydropteroate synthase-like protein
LKALIVTGSLARQLVEDNVKESRAKAEVLSLPIQVAALMTPEYVSSRLRGMAHQGFDLVMLPGMMRGDVSSVSMKIGIPAFKGPKHAADLPLVLDRLKEIKLSSVTPACELLQDAIRRRALRELASINKKGVPAMVIGRGRRILGIGGTAPMRVLAEIVDASTMHEKTIASWARYFANSGADIVDIGMVTGGGHAKEAQRAVQAAKRAAPLPVSIDTNDIQEMRAAVRARTDLILSINAANMEQVARFASKVPIVVTPASDEKSWPEDATRRVEQLEENLVQARRLGFRMVIADPVLSPIFMPSLIESLMAYHNFSQRHPRIPILFGAGNTIELMDGDSAGANLVLAGIASEVRASILLVTEASDKTRGCVRELSTAAKMATLAKVRGSPPKDLGLDLLMLKEKRIKQERYDASLEVGVPVVSEAKRQRFICDPKGCFKMTLDRDAKQIVLYHYVYGESTPSLVIKGEAPLAISRAVIERNLISRLDHAAYIGIELEKAEVALRTQKSYIQDQPIFS